MTTYQNYSTALRLYAMSASELCVSVHNFCSFVIKACHSVLQLKMMFLWKSSPYVLKFLLV